MGKIFYIGKGKGKRAFSKDGRNKHWTFIANKHGFIAKILAYWKTEKESFDHEKLLISCFKDMGYSLANKTLGGEGNTGHKWSEERKANHSQLMKGNTFNVGVKRSAEHIEALRKANLGNKWNVGKKTSNETKEKLSLIHKGKKKPNVSLALKGRKQPESLTKKLAELRSKTVICKELDINFNSIKIAAEWLKLNGFPKAVGTAISATCLGKRKTAYSYHWE